MKVEDIIYDIKTVLLALTDDTRVTDAYLLHKILNYRAVLIGQELVQLNEVPAEFYQRMGRYKPTPVSSSDNPNVYSSSVRLGKIEVPAVIDGLIKIRSASRNKMLHSIDWDHLMEMISLEDERLQQFIFYAVTSRNELYVYPYQEELDVSGVLEDPMNGYVWNTLDVMSSALVVDTEYTVMDGHVLETLIGSTSGTVYNTGTSFTVQNGYSYTYSANAKVKLSQQIKSITKYDDFPISREMAQNVVLAILTNEYELERRSIADVVDDAQDQFKVVSSRIQ